MPKIFAASPLRPSADHTTADGQLLFADLLRSCRLRAGLTQQALADLSTISSRAIRDIEAGRANARMQTVVLLAEALRLRGIPRELFLQTGHGRRSAARLADGPELIPPRPANALLGREREAGALTEALESGRRRMVSLCGLPGVGKTRLAAEIAVRLAGRRGWPVLWIGAATQAPGGAGTERGPLVRALRLLINSGARDVSVIGRLVGAHEALLVLDGVADVWAPIGVEELLACCPGIRIIVTSRAPWQVTGVQPTVVAPLPTPEPERLCNAPAETPTDSAAVRLLLERVSELRPGVVLAPRETAAAVVLSRRLDGLPLALEAAAAAAVVLSLPELARLPIGDLLGLSVPTDGGESDSLGEWIGRGLRRLDPGRLALLRELADDARYRSVTDLATSLGRSLGEVADDLAVLIGQGLVMVPQGADGSRLRVPNLLRALLGDPARAAPGRRDRSCPAGQRGCAIRALTAVPLSGGVTQISSKPAPRSRAR